MRFTSNSCSRPSFLYRSTSPRITLYLSVSSSRTQWAAVIIHSGAISVPPQRWFVLNCNRACQGHSPRTASAPLTTREEELKLRPQLAVRKKAIVWKTSIKTNFFLSSNVTAQYGTEQTLNEWMPWYRTFSEITKSFYFENKRVL